MTKFHFVAKQSDIIKNIKKLYEYLTSSDKTLSDFAFNLMKRGRAYVAYYDDDCDKWLFAPSRFVGYRSNNYSKHKMNYEKDGKKTCKKIDEILKSGYRTNEELEMLLKEIFEVPSYKEANRHFWILGDDSKLDKKTMEEQVQKYIEQKKLKEHISYEGRISGKNRKKIIEQLGTTCEACGRKMEEIYGEIGRGYIELHHLKPFCNLDIGTERVVTPSDFSVLCPNCHKMIHKTNEISDINKFKKRIKKSI